MAFALMTAAAPFRWSDPSTWTWPVWLWVALVLAPGVRWLWRWFERHQAQSWRTVTGRIDLVSVRRKNRFRISAISHRRGLPYTAELAYSYSLEGQHYAGTYQRDLPSEDEGQEFVRELQGKPVIVSCNPMKPARSLLLENAVRSLLETRPPPPGGVFQPHVADLPVRIKRVLWPLIVVSAVGLVLSIWVHLGTLAGRTVVPESVLFMLSMGIFLVFIPAMMVSKDRLGDTQRKDFWKLALRGAPDWMRYMVYGFSVYMMVNFAILYFLSSHGSGTSSGSPSASVWRGFSGMWMAFYSAALAILYSAAVGSGKQP